MPALMAASWGKLPVLSGGSGEGRRRPVGQAEAEAVQRAAGSRQVAWP